MNVYPLGTPLHEAVCTDNLVCLIGVANEPVKETAVKMGDGEDDTFTYVSGGATSLCFAFVIKQNGKIIQSEIKHLRTLEGLDLFEKEFRMKLNETNEQNQS